MNSCNDITKNRYREVIDLEKFQKELIERENKDYKSIFDKPKIKNKNPIRKLKSISLFRDV